MADQQGSHDGEHAEVRSVIGDDKAKEAAPAKEIKPHPLDVLDLHLADVVQSASKRKAIIKAFKDAIAAAVATYKQERSDK